MDIKEFVKDIQGLGITAVTGIPDSALKPFCDYMNREGREEFNHYVPANEGAAVGIAVGSYLATGKPACIYAQNSGIGNIINPITSLANEMVYGIPMLFLFGWRGEPGTKDEPQHQFMGKITPGILDVLQIGYAILTKEETAGQRKEAFKKAGEALQMGRQFAFIITRDFFDSGKDGMGPYQNNYSFVREHAIQQIISSLGDDDIIVSTTGKISREVYEQCGRLKGHHKQAFLTVGGMGHASMIAFGIAAKRPDKDVYCIDGDGAALMHMGSLAFLGKQKPGNLVHICLNNEAHESVGGMPTGSAGLAYADVAASCGYPAVFTAETPQQLKDILAGAKKRHTLTFIEIKVSMESRDSLGRPKEAAAQNKKDFMLYHGGIG